jgi:hypothetical protein
LFGFGGSRFPFYTPEWDQLSHCSLSTALLSGHLASRAGSQAGAGRVLCARIEAFQGGDGGIHGSALLLEFDEYALDIQERVSGMNFHRNWRL